ncbi:class I SAM-dependent methyltransferase [Psychroserpens sp.]|uniref:class I SAM-dependent methyltransferase n=1 Tax=Psychroserpens sp. TaxID=2020870 RepID=UPI001B1FC600|nr:class I SAM-dependent methyltransferase [Psychroserpens sp.]MBO6605946.1 class I SAM-dependent methyltransferase [Psychroserpens sp.]MBO6630953.1 class I SAM-dependent methyltransferase [Psychroserpens sp.]MBO6652683.1 class I SAM-dependent methyltransferase [Psychroserpens sp.]MBO6681545.1 class I SAM-dependent methyltransferase [Psychroserpens sp.]MBO6749320.1 class I SAM-dependent methyltransferase [Psychroserpens sp.]
MSKKAFDVNRQTWNEKVKVHAESDMYDLKAFKKGKSSLMPYELNAIGDVQGKSLLHLQCHFGQDTLSWSRMGANCVGVDLSDEGIGLAKTLNSELELNASFVRCNVLETSTYVNDIFDIVFTSYGVIGWLPDLKPWAQMIAERLKPGGFFYIVEFHPIVWMFDYEQDPPTMRYGYMQDEVIYEEYEGTYANTKSKMISKEYGWNHGLSEVINSLIEAGLQIEYLNEYDESPYNVLPDLERTKSGMYVSKDKLYPLLFEIKAIKP